MDLNSKCQHLYIENYTCNECGLSIDSERISTEYEFSKDHIYIKNSDYIGFDKDLNELPIDDKIVEWINMQLRELPKSIFKKETRTKILFSYVYLYHLIENIDFDPKSVSYMLNMDKKSVEEAVKIISGTAAYKKLNQHTRQIKASIVILTPESFITSLAKKIDMDEFHVLQIKNICSKVIKNNELLLDEDPLKLAVGVIRYYYDINKSSFTLISSRFGLSATVTKKYLNMVADAMKDKNYLKNN